MGVGVGENNRRQAGRQGQQAWWSSGRLAVWSFCCAVPDSGEGQFLRGEGDGRVRRRSESLGSCQRLLGGTGRRGDPIWRASRVRVGRGRADACAGPQVCENLRGAARGWDASGHATVRGSYVRGFSLPSPKRRDPRRAGFVLRCADKKHRPKEARDVTGTSTGAPLLSRMRQPGDEGEEGRVWARGRAISPQYKDRMTARTGRWGGEDGASGWVIWCHGRRERWADGRRGLRESQAKHRGGRRRGLLCP